MQCRPGGSSPPYRATLAPVALSRGIPLNAVIPNLPSSSPECCHASHQTHLARLFNLEIGFNNTPSPPSPLSWITASPTILDRGPLHVALAILAPMAGRRCVMAVGAIDGQPSPLGDNALWQPNSPRHVHLCHIWPANKCTVGVLTSHGWSTHL